MSILFIDTETGGLDASRNPIIQAAWIIEDDSGEVIQERAMDIVPERDDEFNLGALEINGFTLERLKAGKGLAYMMDMLKIDCLPRMGLWVCGHNVQFDINFLHAAAKKSNYYLSMFLDTRLVLDTRSILAYYKKLKIVSPNDCKLTTACKYFGIEIDAHDALSDIRATRRLYQILDGLAESAFADFHPIPPVQYAQTRS